MAFEIRLLWRMNPDFYAIWAVFIGSGGGLQYIDSEPKETMTAKKAVRGFYTFFLRLETGQPSPHDGVIFFLNCTDKLEKRENKFHWKNSNESSEDGALKLQILISPRGRKSV